MSATSKKASNFTIKCSESAPFKVKTDYAKFDIANPPLNLTMNQTEFERGGSLSHLGLQVESTEEVLEIGKALG